MKVKVTAILKVRERSFFRRRVGPEESLIMSMNVKSPRPPFLLYFLLKNVTHPQEAVKLDHVYCR